MKLLLSGAQNSLAPQMDLSKSLGGYMSNTPVPNNRVNALFGDISCLSITKKSQETVAVFLYNDGTEKVDNLVLQQIVSNNQGLDDSQANFEWAPVQSQDKHYIEKIGSKKDTPFFGDFFNPTARREDAILKITSGGVAGDVVSVLGVDSVLLGNTKEDVVDAIVNSFENNLDFTVEEKSIDEIYFQRKEIIETGDLIELVSPGNASANNVNFSGGKDNGILIVEELNPGESIGLWIRRTIKGKSGKNCKSLEIEYDAKFGTEFSEGVMKETGEVECLEVIFSWD